jgi:hypothetical protein
MRWLAGLGLLVLGACSVPPPPAGSEVRMDVMRPATVGDVSPDGRFRTEAERRYFTRAAGLREAAASGRVVVARCTMGDGDLVFTHAVLGEMPMPRPNEVIRVRLGNREAGELDRVLGMVTDPPGLTRGSVPYEIVAYRSIVPWSTTAIEGEVSPFVQAQYGKIRSGRVVRCLPP